jgi:hypothetical protein
MVDIDAKNSIQGSSSSIWLLLEVDQVDKLIKFLFSSFIKAHRE